MAGRWRNTLKWSEATPEAAYLDHRQVLAAAGALVLGGLGIEPIEALEHRLGLTGLRVLVAGLAVAPLWRLTGIAACCGSAGRWVSSASSTSRWILRSG